MRADIDPALAARLISAVMDGIQEQWLLDESVDMTPLFAEFVRGYLLPRPDRGRLTDRAERQARTSAFARATSPSHARLGFGCRSNVSRSQPMSPNVGR